MKKKIHPKYHESAKITCACGNSIEVGSTVEAMEIEICSACHPFFTGKKKLVDTAGQVDRFKKRVEKASKMKQDKKEAKEKKEKEKKKTVKKKKETKPTKAKTAKKPVKAKKVAKKK